MKFLLENATDAQVGELGASAVDVIDILSAASEPVFLTMSFSFQQQNLRMRFGKMFEM